MDNPIFIGFKKIPRLSREIIITEKIDGTNGVIYIDESNNLFIGSKNRWLDEHNENHGFYHWAMERKEELLKLGKGYHYGEFYGLGIQRNYNLKEKHFALFNINKWVKDRIIPLKEKQQYCPEVLDVVPVLYQGIFDTLIIEHILDELKFHGSYASPNFPNPEGIIIYHLAGGYYFKKTFDDKPKGE